MPYPTKYDKLAVATSTFSLFLGILVSFYLRTGIFKVVKPIVLIGTLVGYALILIHYSFIIKGYQWARILFLAFFLLGIIFFAFDHKKIIASISVSAVSVFNYVFQWIAGAASAVFVCLSIKNHKDFKSKSTNNNGLH